MLFVVCVLDLYCAGLLSELSMCINARCVCMVACKRAPSGDVIAGVLSVLVMTRLYKLIQPY